MWLFALRKTDALVSSCHFRNSPSRVCCRRCAELTAVAVWVCMMQETFMASQSLDESLVLVPVQPSVAAQQKPHDVSLLCTCRRGWANVDA